MRDGRPPGKGDDRRASCGRRARRAQVESGIVGSEVASWEEGRSSSPRRADGGFIRALGGVGFLERMFWVRSPPSLSLTRLRLLFPVPMERGGRRRPARGGGGKRLCRRRLKQRRCESGGLRAPFLCTETESGFEAATALLTRYLALLSLWLPPPQVRPQRVQKRAVYNVHLLRALFVQTSPC